MIEDAAAGRPFLAAMVISKWRGDLPAPGFFDCAARLGRYPGGATGPNARAFHAAELKAVLALEPDRLDRCDDNARPSNKQRAD